ncbi:DUF4386 domain-containing protein [Pseudonocardia sp.]|uniref:DUF4386 domain-containing protein n=1 Tax=Pseudonocardia sp. TaxID=60912 RepID=UPI00260F3C16|nr:DUF4386 domain-containing protein [Pseudonocardia sp.]
MTAVSQTSPGPSAAAQAAGVTDTTPRAAALWAGSSYAALFVLAIFANFAVVTRLVDPDDPAATLTALAAEAPVVRAAVLAFGVVFVLDVVIAWALFVVLRPAGRDRSLLAAWSRLTYTAFLGVAIVPLFIALQLSSQPAFAGLDPATREAGVAAAVAAFDLTWLVGLAVFGLHLVVVGATIVGSRIAPRPLGWLLVVAGAAYALDTAAHVALVDYDRYAGVLLAVVAVPSVVGELWLTLWLLLRAGRGSERSDR